MTDLLNNLGVVFNGLLTNINNIYLLLWNTLLIRYIFMIFFAFLLIDLTINLIEKNKR